MKLFVVPFTVFVIFISQFGMAQQKTGTPLLDSLLSEKKHKTAQTELQAQIDKLTTNKRYDSLSGYPYYVGKITLENSNQRQAIKEMNAFVTDFKKHTSNPIYFQDLYAEIGSFYQSIGLHKEETKNHKTALEYALKIPGKPGKKIGKGYYNLGTGQLREGNVSQAIDNYKKALKHYKSDPETNFLDYYFSYSGMGTSMYYASKIDSSIYFYQKAVDNVAQLEDSPINSYYRPALLLNNIAGLYSFQGQTTQSLEAMKKCIEYNKEFLESDAETYKKTDARRAHFQYIDNLAGIYEKLGDYKKALDLLTYSYSGKLQNFETGNPELFKSKILLGNAQLNLLNFQEAENHFTEGITAIKKLPGNFYDWSASAHYGLAKLYAEDKQVERAEHFYEKAAADFSLSSQNYYDPIILTFFEDASQFYAETNQKAKALQLAEKAYKYVTKHQGKNTLPAFLQTVNLAGIYFEIGETEKALEYSTNALKTFEDKAFQREYALDSIQVEFSKPVAILIQTRSQYLLKKEKDTTFLKELLINLQEAISTLNRRKQFVADAENVKALIEENNQLYDFAKQLNVDLYERTQNETYLANVLSLHETSLYNRIRSRLNLRSEINVPNVPTPILMREKKLKEGLSIGLLKEGLNNYFELSDQWDAFKDSLKANYPKYYRMRYAKIEPSLKNMKQFIPDNTTVVRYVFIEESLYALVLTNTEKSLYRLSFKNVQKDIAQINENSFNITEVGPKLKKMYDALWQPFEKEIGTEKVIIIPDGELYNVSFETLTPKRITSFKELATKSLLAKHTISYNFSFLVLKNQHSESNFSENFIAFAPEFSSEMKTTYKSTLKDSLLLDQEYLTLLPQPFSINLVDTYSKKLNGITYVNENASKDAFINHAKNHKIIHIGTHAESNNISPELSRLIFAKNVSEHKKGENFLYTYQIYNCDLSSDLAILTACETGKPSYQAGEGMISLAHAFAYAGSESILTSLWKIDEQSSAEIIATFYDNLQNGLPKDQALKEAKLTYLSKAEGRTLAPLYWGGLALMGNSATIELQQSGLPWYVYLIAALLMGSLFFYFLKRKNT
ncbi:CHAT domain-containing protein [Marixanthomonas ophiurae]|uniref:CHAT domain-containing protein n=1 Tax=Marixanthomonas ophiurae TaxID=387659 RepID=A0A3E1Q9R9_9FLAO|nr:CHAT domain-containing protein [Marixanthomonas ophiurae]RFN58854.1 CHAT domain-containing protein [Marixanthomonas ophiurae]